MQGMSGLLLCRVPPATGGGGRRKRPAGRADKRRAQGGKVGGPQTLQIIRSRRLARAARPARRAVRPHPTVGRAQERGDLVAAESSGLSPKVVARSDQADRQTLPSKRSARRSIRVWEFFIKPRSGRSSPNEAAVARDSSRTRLQSSLVLRLMKGSVRPVSSANLFQSREWISSSFARLAIFMARFGLSSG